MLWQFMMCGVLAVRVFCVLPAAAVAYPCHNTGTVCNTHTHPCPTIAYPSAGGIVTSSEAPLVCQRPAWPTPHNSIQNEARAREHRQLQQQQRQQRQPW